MNEGLRILGEVRKQIGVPVLTDVHAQDEIAAAASVVDVIQTPAFLSRQTDFIRACAQSGKPVNIKKGQFLAPGDMKNVVDKARDGSARCRVKRRRFLACERGASFGYTPGSTCARWRRARRRESGLRLTGIARCVARLVRRRSSCRRVPETGPS